jgi:DNA-nicking Smr family endonuclease
MNKYERVPEYILDLHGKTTKEAKLILVDLIKRAEYKHVRIITGKASFRDTGPVLRKFVENYLTQSGIDFNHAKLYNGGDGALEVYF